MTAGPSGPSGPHAAAPALWAAVAGVAALSAMFTFAPWLHAHGLYLRDAVLTGEWWRLVTAMWVHLGWRHWLADTLAAAGLLLLGGVAARTRALLAVLAACGLAAQAALLRLPEVAWYGGLSGALHGLAAWTGLRLLQRPGWPRVAGVALCLGVLVKVWLEQSWLAAVVFEPAWGFGVVRAAHAAGALAGLLLWLAGEWLAARRAA
ncbi:rhombosortase [Cupriavidus sp. USMAHM13]|uniref:rhombosortase n=1 Tax=Cupriavidus sp. USMAHM13 TaxID=1389192 RepID=UPI0008A68F67|nr:rhombosortase [Cupriavidus sp. USMAHM13]AOY99299.1 rhombosortase [Cupriavidus sp. USMAHM13]